MKEGKECKREREKEEEGKRKKERGREESARRKEKDGVKGNEEEGKII